MARKILVAQGGGPTAVINQSLVGVALEARRFPDIAHVYGALHGVRGIVNEDLVDLGHESVGQSRSGRGDPGRGARLDARQARPQILPGDLQACCARTRSTRSSTSAATIPPTPCASSPRRRRRRGITPCAPSISPRPSTTISSASITRRAIPSAARFVAQAFMGANLDNLALKGVYVAVVMGRHAGFLTAASALARKYPDDGPHLIYLPERVFVGRQVPGRREGDVSSKHGRCMIAVSEGIHDDERRADHHQARQDGRAGRAWQCPAFRHRRARRSAVRGDQEQARHQARARRHVRLSAALLRRLRVRRRRRARRARSARRRCNMRLRADERLGGDPPRRRLRRRLSADPARGGRRQDAGDGGPFHQRATATA